jgi:hypothetical protein
MQVIQHYRSFRASFRSVLKLQREKARGTVRSHT